MSFYHLPNPYDPRYAIPRYVMAEPPGRGTFTTQWLPRGTIPTLVPDYLAKPGKELLGRDDAGLGSLGGSTIGGSSLHGSSLKGSTLAGDTLGARSRRGGGRRALGAAGDADPIAAYGNQVAAYILARVQTLSPATRKETLRAILNAIDPSLWSTIETKGGELSAQGLPAKAALARAIATAMSSGMSRELVEIGKRAAAGDRMPVKVKSQVGLAAYSGAASMAYYDALDMLGADDTCPFEWVPATGTTPAHSERMRAGAARRYPPPDPCPVSKRITGMPAAKTPEEIAARDAANAAAAARTAAAAAYAAAEKVKVGPFTWLAEPVTQHLMGDFRESSSSARNQQFKGALDKVMRAGTSEFPSDTAAFNGLDKWFGVNPSQLVYKRFINGSTPLFRTKHPKTGHDWGVYLISTKDRYSVDWKKIPESKSFFGKLWDTIVSLPATLLKGAVDSLEKVADVVGDALGKAKDMACKALNHPAAETVAQGAAMAYGMPPQVGSGGVGVAKKLCGGEEAPPELPPPPPEEAGMPGWVLPAVAVGGGLVLMLALKKKKKHP